MLQKKKSFSFHKKKKPTWISNDNEIWKTWVTELQIFWHVMSILKKETFMTNHKFRSSTCMNRNAVEFLSHKQIRSLTLIISNVLKVICFFRSLEIFENTAQSVFLHVCLSVLLD